MSCECFRPLRLPSGDSANAAADDLSDLRRLRGPRRERHESLVDAVLSLLTPANHRLGARAAAVNCCNSRAAGTTTKSMPSCTR
jgi:hypothetical protein